MFLKRKFFQNKGMPSLDSIVFDTTGLLFQGDKTGVRIWQTPDGDGIGLYFFPKPPDILADINSVSSVYSYYGSLLTSANIRGIFISILDIDGCQCVKMIIRSPQDPSGMVYLGSLTFPFKDFSFVIKMQCAERGITGTREALILDELIGNGEVKINQSGKMEGWEKSLYGVTSTPWIINRAEEVEYDIRFPEHPLSILRRTIGHIEKTIKVSDMVKKAPKF